MRFKETVWKEKKSNALVLADLMVCGLLMVTSVCLSAEGEWTKKTDMPTMRDALSASVVDGKIYVIGGFDNNVEKRVVEEYDPATDKWEKRADMPTQRSNLATSVVNGKIYAIGGWWSSAVEEYDPATDTWTKKAPMPTARMGLSISVVNGRIYAIGGGTGAWPNMISVPNVEEYDPVTDTWTKKRDMPNKRYYFCTCVINRKIYAIGGFTSNWVTFATVEEYDPVADMWINKGDMPIPSAAAAAGVVNGKIYYIGGTRNWGTTFSTVWIYDPIADSWEEGLAMPTARRWIAAGVVDDKIYVIGGSVGNTFFSTVEEYTPEGWPFAATVSSQGKLATTWGSVKRGF